MPKLTEIFMESPCYWFLSKKGPDPLLTPDETESTKNVSSDTHRLLPYVLLKCAVSSKRLWLLSGRDVLLPLCLRLPPLGPGGAAASRKSLGVIEDTVLQWLSNSCFKIDLLTFCRTVTTRVKYVWVRLQSLLCGIWRRQGLKWCRRSSSVKSPAPKRQRGHRTHPGPPSASP